MKRFYDKVQETSTGCHEWQASFRGSYGAFKVNGKVQSAHRVAYRLANGEFDESLMVCHHCDNPKCVNPEHLFLGTNSDNMKDAYQKGRISVPHGKRFQNGHTPWNK